jgi:ABC-2 type transport system permease protein
MPAITLVTIYLTHLAMLAMDMGHLAAQGRSVSQFLDNLPLMQVWLDLAYAFLLAVFWWAPLWSWLLLVSAWSKRMTFLWAVGPPLAICVIERMAFGTDYAWKLLAKRLDGGLGDGFTTPPPHVFELPWPDPVAFVTKPGVWIGLVIAAAFLAGAVWMRRRREPI